ncbi:MAG: 16S rRNA processing protein RimM [Rickettsiaceae bacterium]|nr:16S rRNA processing protein RimM [Rickettsiaceae bacterium]
MLSQDKLILIGVISSAHGVHGDIVVKSFTDPVENLFNLPVMDKNNKILNLKLIRPHSKKGLICHLDSCNTREKAESMKKTALYCLRSNLPKLDNNDEFYIEDLKNLKVKDINGQDIGVITNVMNYGAGDIIEIKFHLKGELILYPFTKEFFSEVEKDYIILYKKDL